MLNERDLEAILLNMTDSLEHNISIIQKTVPVLYINDDNQTLLHIFVDYKYDENKCFLAIKSLLKAGLNPNATDCFKYNFIQTALYTGYSEDFILKIITEALKYNLDVNHTDDDEDTMVHSAIYSEEYLGEIDNIYDLLCSNGFNSNLKDHNSRNIISAMLFQKSCSEKPIFLEQVKSLTDKFYKNLNEYNTKMKFENTNIRNSNNSFSRLNIPKEVILELEKFGTILTNKEYYFKPTIGRDKEVKNLLITLAQDKKMPLIVGESGVGKTAIVDELAFQIKMEEVPNFLKKRTILEVNPTDIVAGCKYRGMFEENMNKLLKLCEKYNIIIFIDEIHTIYGVGSSEDSSNDMAAMLKHHIDKTNLKVIGTTTEKEYNEFFGNDALKRRFEKITVKEPTDNILYQIIDKVLNDYSIKNEIFFENEEIKNKIVNILLSATQKSHRVYEDVVNNPDLAISIIDKAFAFAKVYECKFITEEHFIESLKLCDRIYDFTINQAIDELCASKNSTSDSMPKILKISDYRRTE